MTPRPVQYGTAADPAIYRRLLAAIDRHDGRLPCQTMQGDWLVDDMDDAKTARAAADKCQACPITAICAEYALEAREPEGTWGGWTARDRRRHWAPKRSPEAGRRYRRALKERQQKAAELNGSANGQPPKPRDNSGRFAPRPEPQTHCIHGHPLEGSNIYVTKDGRRQCRTCKGTTARLWNQKQGNRT